MQVPRQGPLGPGELGVGVGSDLVTSHLVIAERSLARPNTGSNHVEVGRGELVVEGREGVGSELGVVRSADPP